MKQILIKSGQISCLTLSDGIVKVKRSPKSVGIHPLGNIRGNPSNSCCYISKAVDRQCLS